MKIINKNLKFLGKFFILLAVFSSQNLYFNKLENADAIRSFVRDGYRSVERGVSDAVSDIGGALGSIGDAIGGPFGYVRDAVAIEIVQSILMNLFDVDMGSPSVELNPIQTNFPQGTSTQGAHEPVELEEIDMDSITQEINYALELQETQSHINLISSYYRQCRNRLPTDAEIAEHLSDFAAGKSLARIRSEVCNYGSGRENLVCSILGNQDNDYERFLLEVYSEQQGESLTNITWVGDIENIGNLNRIIPEQTVTITENGVYRLQVDVVLNNTTTVVDCPVIIIEDDYVVIVPETDLVRGRGFQNAQIIEKDTSAQENEEPYETPRTYSDEDLNRAIETLQLLVSLGVIQPGTDINVIMQALGLTTGGNITNPTPIQTGPIQTSLFTRNLTIGSTGNDVRELQRFLNQQGFIVSAQGAGSVGNETTYFGPATQNALSRYQAANNISPASGYFGPLTRSRITGVPVASVPNVQSPSTNLNNQPSQIPGTIRQDQIDAVELR